MIRVLHLSDFHLDGKYEKKSEQLVENIITSLKEQDKIDFVIFSGDMLNKGGIGYDNIDLAFNRFKEILVVPLLKALRLNTNRFFFAIGNHDLIIRPSDISIDNSLDLSIQKEQDVDKLMDMTKDDDTYLRRQECVRKFRDDFYKLYPNGDKQLTPFQSNFKFIVDNNKIGITILNTSWRCNKNDFNRLTLGLQQILSKDTIKFLEDCNCKIAIGHHHYSMLKNFEQIDVEEKIREHYNIYFSGHTHSGQSRLNVKNGKGFFEVICPGFLANNIYEEDIQYQNGYQIVEIDIDKKSEKIEYYEQNKYENFQKIYEQNDCIPDKNDKELIQKLELKTKEQDEKYKKIIEQNKIYPFLKIDDFLDKYNYQYEFIENAKLKQIIKIMQHTKENYRLVALSGMGKTRLVYEAFKSKRGENIYYTDSLNIIDKLKYILQYNSEDNGIIILDNCPKQILDKVKEKLKETKIKGKYRIISLYNILENTEIDSEGAFDKLEYSDTADVVKSYIENTVYLKKKVEIQEFIKRYSGDIPYMAFLLVDSYKQLGAVKLNGGDELLNKLLQTGENDRILALATLALFQPLGYSEHFKDEYEFVIHNNNITLQYDKSNDSIEYLFDSVIKEYKQKQLIEQPSYWINVRPQPLAEWLITKWFNKATSRSFAKMLKDIANNDNLSNRLIEAMHRRLIYMNENESAQELVKNLTKIHGPFDEESIVCSKAGSQLLLSMSYVNPSSVAACIFRNLENTKKEDLYNIVKDDIRRNLVWGLTKLCVKEESFFDAARSLGLLAKSENEEFSNNSVGQFQQLFHIMLSGTLATFEERLKVLEYFRHIQDFNELIIKTIINSFNTRNLMRDGKSMVFGHTKYEEKTPTIKEVKAYWHNEIQILKDIINEDSSLIEYCLDKLPENVYDFCETEASDLLLELLEFFIKKSDIKWLNMRDKLIFECRYSKIKIEKKYKVQFEIWIEKLTPTDFLSRLRDANKFIKFSNKKFEEEKLERFEKMRPFAKEFFKEKIFENQIILGNLMDDEKSNNFEFTKALSEYCKKNKDYNTFNSFILQYILQKDKNYISTFLLEFCSNIDDNIVIGKLDYDLYLNEYYSLSCCLKGMIDGQDMSLLNIILEDVKNGKYSSLYINNYIHYYRHFSNENHLKLCNKLYKVEGIAQIEVFYHYLLNFTNFYNKDSMNDDKYREVTENYLLNFDFQNCPSHNMEIEVIHKMASLLREYSDKTFAKGVSKLIIKILSGAYLANNQFDELFNVLLPKYQDTILDDIFVALTKSYDKSKFFENVRAKIGSGFHTGAGPLFQCNEEKLKKACLQYPDVLPHRFASMCPVYNRDNNGKIISFGQFFYWLISTFPTDKDILLEFSRNLNTICWVGSMQSLYEQQIECYKLLIKFKNKIVKEWALKEIKYTQKELEEEKAKDDYMTMM